MWRGSFHPLCGQEPTTTKTFEMKRRTESLFYSRYSHSLIVATLYIHICIYNMVLALVQSNVVKRPLQFSASHLWPERKVTAFNLVPPGGGAAGRTYSRWTINENEEEVSARKTSYRVRDWETAEQGERGRENWLNIRERECRLSNLLLTLSHHTKSQNIEIFTTPIRFIYHIE